MNTETKPPEISTPWGFTRQYRVLAPGVMEVSTPSHGGLILSENRQQAIRAAFPDFKPWGGNLAHLEEDCDIVIGVALFVDAYSPEMRSMALDYLRRDITGRNYYKVTTGQLDALMGIDDTGQPFAYDVEPLPAL